MDIDKKVKEHERNDKDLRSSEWLAELNSLTRGGTIHQSGSNIMMISDNRDDSFMFMYTMMIYDNGANH